MAPITLNGRSYNYTVDSKLRSIRLEDNETKAFWFWQSREPSANSTRTALNSKRLPDQAFVAAVQHLFREGPSTPRGHVALKQKKASNNMELHLHVLLEITDWWIYEKIELQFLPRTPLDHAIVRLHDLRTAERDLQREILASGQYPVIQRAMVAMQAQISLVERDVRAVSSKYLLVERTTAAIICCAINLVIAVVSVYTVCRVAAWAGAWEGPA